MSIKQVKVFAKDLKVGMFVSSLDRPWSQTPFPVQGFLVNGQQDITALRAHCDYVFIDITKGRRWTSGMPLTGYQAGTGVNKYVESEIGGNPPFPKSEPNPWRTSVAPIEVNAHVYQTAVPLKTEVEYAGKALLKLCGQYNSATKQISKGKDFDYSSLKDSVTDMVDSVVRCPDAFTWLMRLRMKDQHTHDHSMRSALWAVQFARHIGMTKEDMSTLCMGTLLKDIGKIKLPNSLLRKKDRTEEETLEYQSFIEHGVAMLKAFKNVDAPVITVVKYHCEHHNGMGFPEGLKGGKIPLLARIAGMATAYDACSNPRESLDPVAPSKAVNILYNMQDKQFSEDLVIKFIQSIGLYPTGTLVELTTGDLAVVVEQHADTRLMPRVAVLNQGQFLEGKASEGYVLIDLKDEEAARKALVKAGQDIAASVETLGIVRDLEPSSYDVDFSFISSILMKNTRNILSRVLSIGTSEKSDSGLSLMGRLKSYLRP